MTASIRCLSVRRLKNDPSLDTFVQPVTPRWLPRRQQQSAPYINTSLSVLVTPHLVLFSSALLSLNTLDTALSSSDHPTSALSDGHVCQANLYTDSVFTYLHPLATLTESSHTNPLSSQEVPSASISAIRWTTTACYSMPFRVQVQPRA